MLASVWLQPIGDQRELLRDLIARLAAEHGTMPFEPHLTVCTIINPTEEAVQAATDCIATSRSLPLLVGRTGFLHSPTVPFRAVTVGIQNTPGLRLFREMLRELTGANQLIEPHISLLYTIAANRRPTEWAGDAAMLEAIGRECERRLAATEFLLADPILVAPNGEWTDVASWTVIRRF
jgi:2'-5' RNA ligase